MSDLFLTIHAKAGSIGRSIGFPVVCGVWVITGFPNATYPVTPHYSTNDPEVCPGEFLQAKSKYRVCVFHGSRSSVVHEGCFVFVGNDEILQLSYSYQLDNFRMVV